VRVRQLAFKRQMGNVPRVCVADKGVRPRRSSSTRSLDNLRLDFPIWLQRQDLTVRRLLRIHKSRAQRLELRLASEPRCLQISLQAKGCSVWVTHRGRVWDLLLDLDLAPQQTATGWHCLLCKEAAAAARFDSLAALRAHHLFDPLVNWLAHRFLPARFLALHGAVGSASWAELLRARPTVGSLPARRLIRLHGCDTCRRSATEHG